MGSLALETPVNCHSELMEDSLSEADTVLTFPCVYLVRPYLEVNPHDKAYDLAN